MSKSKLAKAQWRITLEYYGNDTEHKSNAEISLRHDWIEGDPGKPSDQIAFSLGQILRMLLVSGDVIQSLVDDDIKDMFISGYRQES